MLEYLLVANDLEWYGSIRSFNLYVRERRLYRTVCDLVDVDYKEEIPSTRDVKALTVYQNLVFVRTKNNVYRYEKSTYTLILIPMLIQHIR